MRFQEKIHEGKVSRFAVLYGGHSFRSAVAEAGKLGVRDVFYFRQRDHPGEGVDLLYYDYEQFDFGLLDRWLNPSWKREHGSTPPPNASEERARLGHEVRDRLFDRRTRYELALPYRVGPLCFLQEPKRGLEPIFWQAEPDFLMEMVRSVAG
jgi:hypothetical protein